MSIDAVERARQQLSPFTERYVPESLSYSLRFLAYARGTQGGWGRLQGALTDVRSTVAALQVFSNHGDFLQPGEFEDSVQYLCNQLSRITNTSTLTEDIHEETLDEVSMIASFLTKLDRSKYQHLLDTACQYLIGHKQEDGGYGNGTTRVDTTARVLSALNTCVGEKATKLHAPIRDAVSYLLSAVNVDMGWGLQKNATTSSRYTALVVSGLLDAGEAGNVITKALESLRQQQRGDGSWAQEDQVDAVYTTALVTRTLLQAKIPKDDSTVRAALKFLAAAKNEDFGWGWYSGGMSEVEPTANVLQALFDSGVEEYVSVTTAIDVLRNAFEETAALISQNKDLEKNTDAIVHTRIQTIINTKDELEKKVLQLEAESKRYAQQQLEVNRLRKQIVDLRSSDLIRYQLQDLLEQALQVASGRTQPSPLEILDQVEDLITTYELHKIDSLRTNLLPRILLESIRVPAGYKETFARSFEERLSAEVPPEAARKLVALLSLLPPTPQRDVTDKVRRLVDRVEKGTIRKKKPAPRRPSLAELVNRLERQLTRLIDEYPGTGVEFVRRLLSMLPTVDEAESTMFIAWLRERWSGPVSDLTVPLQLVDQIISLRDGVTLATYREHIGTLERHFSLRP